MLIGRPWVVPLRDAAVATCGAKASALGALQRAGVPVPGGFVVTVEAYRAAGDSTRATGLLDAVRRGLRALGDPPVAVRSSAGDEDAVDGSAAGQYESVLPVQGADDVVAAVRTCWASLHSPRAVAYRHGRVTSSAEPAMAVLVQRLVDADVSGVMFTAEPADPGTVIEASWGLGPAVVGGTVDPDVYRVAVDGAVTRNVAHKRTRVDPQIDQDGGRLVTGEVAPADRDRPALDDDAVTRLARHGRGIAHLLGGAQDVEWAVAHGRTWILQARPVTAAPPPPRPALAPAPGVLTGTPGSRGCATGTVRVVRDHEDFASVRPGDVLVCPFTDPAWTPLLRVAAGVVTETGGALSHAAIVARERGIPAVLGVTGATRRLHDGATVTVDGTVGTVRTTD